MKVLNEYPIYEFDWRKLFLVMFVTLLITLAALFVACVILKTKPDEKDFTIVVIILAIVCACVSQANICHRESGIIQYEVMFEDSMDIQYIKENYIIEEQRGEIYVLKDKEN